MVPKELRNCITCAQPDVEVCMSCPNLDGTHSNWEPKKMSIPELVEASPQYPGDDPKAEGGVKFDQGKPRMELIPTEAILALARVLTFGAKKYADRNWEKGMAWSRAYAAAQRHLIAWFSGETNDPETGFSHLWHALTEVAFLTTYEARGVGTDDRQGTWIKEQQ